MTQYESFTRPSRPVVGSVWSPPALPGTDFPFPLHSQLPVLNAAIDEVQRNVQAPRPLVFTSALTAIALAQQGLLDVQKPNGQQVPTSMMLMVIGDSGERKSTVENVFLHPIREFEREQKIKYREQVSRWTALHDIWNARRKALMKCAAKESSDAASAEQRLLEHVVKEPVKPREFRVLYEDSTPEALFLGLSRNLPTAGLISSEGGGVLNGPALRELSKPNALWSGDQVTVDRALAESYEVSARLTVSLMVQKSAFDEYMEKRGEASRGSGMWARFVVAQPESTQGRRFVFNGTQSWEHREPFAKRIRTLMEENAVLLDQPNKEKLVAEFAPAACERWFEVLNAIEAEIGPGGRYELAGDHASKLADNIARMAAHFHWFEGFEGRISRETLESAISTCFWYSNEFLRLFVPPPQEEVDAHELCWWLYQRQMSGQRYIRKNHIRQYGPNRLRNGRRLQAALDLLQLRGRVSFFMLGGVTCVDLVPWNQFDPSAAQSSIFVQERSNYP
jgi:hypothetical protein